jgi:hypothetical protein
MKILPHFTINSRYLSVLVKFSLGKMGGACGEVDGEEVDPCKQI